MKFYHILTVSTVLLHLTMLAHSQFPPQMPFGSPMGMPMPMPMPLPMMPQQRMPMVVMPYHSKTADSFRRPTRKRSRKRRHEDHDFESASNSESTSDSEETSSDEVNFRAASGSRKRRRQVLTPVVSYVTKDGYVVYQKKIRKDRAKDWLDLGKENHPQPAQSEEMPLRQIKKKYATKKRRHRSRHGHD